MNEKLEKLVELANKSISQYNVTMDKAREKSERKNFILLFSPKNEGFIAGYEDFEDSESAFIWLFGVAPESQGKGIGSKLLEEFENEAGGMGYKKVKSYTFNRFKSKIILSLNRGYRIINTKFDEGLKDYRIFLEKLL